jgi:XTP/dITP diphosphohydrolase
VIRVVLASANQGKAKEFMAAWDGIVDLRSVSDYVSEWQVDETGCTFHENALCKAEAAAEATGLPALADDSGLSVYYLGGQPGVYSARFAGPNASDLDNNQLLLRQMSRAGIRTGAHFTAVLCLKIPGRPPRFSTGRVFGHILTNPRGDNGFGYDPLFQVHGDTRTLAEMSVLEKNVISHRGRALKAMLEILREVR